MGKKGGDGSFLGLFRRKQKDEPPEPDQDDKDKPEAQSAEVEDEPTSEDQREESEGTRRPWENAGDEESAIQTYIEQDSTSREPTAIVDVPLGSSEEGETTLRLALQQASEDTEEVPAGSAERRIGELLDPNSTVHIELPESLMAVGDETGKELSDAADQEPDAEEDIRLTVSEEDSSSDRDAEATEIEETKETEGVPPASESIEIPVFRSDYKPIGLRDVPLSGTVANEDKLGILAHAEALAQFIEDSETPLSLCIQGEAGSGKTTLMRFIRQTLLVANSGGRRLAGRVPQTDTVWLNACPVIPFDSPGDLCFALITSITETIKKGFSEIIDKDARKSRALERAMKIVGDTEKIRWAISRGQIEDLGASESGLASQKATAQGSESNMIMESLQRTKERLVDIVEQYREATGRERIVVFIDDVDLVRPEHALAFLKSIYGSLTIEGLVFVIACNANRLIDSLESDHEARNGSLAVRSFLERLFQASFSLPSGSYDLENYLEDLLRRAGLNFDQTDLRLFLDLLKRSVGRNPFRIKRLINKLALLRAMQKRRAPTENSETEPEILSRLTTTLFGAACLEAAFGSIYQLMLAEMAFSDEDEDNYSGLVALLEQPRGSDERLAAALHNIIQAHPMLTKIPKEPGDSMDPDRAAGFIDLLRSMLVFDDNGRLELKQTRDLESALEMVSLVGSNPAQPVVQDHVRDMATDYSRLVEQAVGKIATNPPQAHNKWAHYERTPGGYGYRMWYRPLMAKAAWGCNRLFYCLNFDLQEGQAVKLGLQCSFGNVIREGVPKEALEELKNAPIFQEGVYENVHNLPGDWMKMQMRFDDMHWRSSGDSKVKQAYAIAGELNRLIEATSHLFDVKAGSGIGSAEKRGSVTRVNAPCPNCGKKDLIVLSRLDDGSLRLQCMNCKSKVQAKTAPTAGRPGQSL